MLGLGCRKVLQEWPSDCGHYGWGLSGAQPPSDYASGLLRNWIKWTDHTEGFLARGVGTVSRGGRSLATGKELAVTDFCC